jgi:hypothetical protein
MEVSLYCHFLCFAENGLDGVRGRNWREQNASQGFPRHSTSSAAALYNFLVVRFQPAFLL